MMSEVKMYDGHGEPCMAEYAYFVKKSDYDAALAREAALGEELELNKSLLTRTPEAFADLITNVLNLTKERDAAEQRNAALTEALEDLLKGSGTSPGANRRYAKARAALVNPTESGASE